MLGKWFSNCHLWIDHKRRKLDWGRTADLSKEWVNSVAVTEHRARLSALEATEKQESGDVT